MKTLNNLLFIAFALLLTISITMNIRQFQNAEKANRRLENLVEAGGENTIEKTYIRDSITHTVFSEKVVSDTRVEKQLAIGKTYADSLEKALKVSIDKIDQVTKINAELSTQLALKESINKEGKRVLTHQDKTIGLNYYPETDSVDLAVNIGLNEARYSKRKWLFGITQNYIDVFPDDNRIKIKGLKSFTIKEKPQRRFGIGVSSGMGIIQSDGALKSSPYIGLGINYNLIEF